MIINNTGWFTYNSTKNLFYIYNKLPIIQHVWGMGSAGCMRKAQKSNRVKTHFHFGSCIEVFLGDVGDLRVKGCEHILIYCNIFVIPDSSSLTVMAPAWGMMGSAAHGSWENYHILDFFLNNFMKMVILLFLFLLVGQELRMLWYQTTRSLQLFFVRYSIQLSTACTT
jgi:hypothetical protein